MDLQELLDSVGLTKTQLAKLMGLSRSSITRMPAEASQEVIDVIDEYKLTDEASHSIPTPNKIESNPVIGKRVKEPEDYTPKEIKLLCVRTGSGQEPRSDVAASIGITVFEFKGMVDRLVDHCQAHDCTSASLLAA